LLGGHTLLFRKALAALLTTGLSFAELSDGGRFSEVAEGNISG
jgi:hypothetical protein